jgi:hypothetical protein
VHQGQHAGVRQLNGDYLERWAIKVLVGMLSSGNVSRTDGVRVKDLHASERLTLDARRLYLGVLFGDTPMPDGGGFHLFLSPRARLENQLEIVLNSHPPGHPEHGLICAVTVQMLGLYFSTAFTILRSEHETLWYRPRAIDLDGRGRLELQWQNTPSNEIVELSRTKEVHDG